MNCQIKTPWKKVIHVHPLDNFCLELIWEDGMTSVIELNELIHGKKILWRLRYPRYFNQVAVDQLGGIFWPEGEDLSPDFLLHHSG
jgi:hypothetical protein